MRGSRSRQRCLSWGPDPAAAAAVAAARMTSRWDPWGGNGSGAAVSHLNADLMQSTAGEIDEGEWWRLKEECLHCAVARWGN